MKFQLINFQDPREVFHRLKNELLIDKCLSGVEVDQEQQFMVDTKGAGGQGHLEVAVVSIYFLCFHLDHDKPVGRSSCWFCSFHVI